MDGKTMQHPFFSRSISNFEEDMAVRKAISASIKEKEKTKEQKSGLISQAKFYGFTCQDVPDDGSCFYHALADQLGQQYSSEALRDIANKHIKKHLNLYENFVNDDKKNFICAIHQPRTWADNYQILALSRELKITIVIIRSDGKLPTIFKQADAKQVVYIGYEVGVHFQSLKVLRDVFEPDGDIARIINKTEDDIFDPSCTSPDEDELQEREKFVKYGLGTLMLAGFFYVAYRAITDNVEMPTPNLSP